MRCSLSVARRRYSPDELCKIVEDDIQREGLSRENGIGVVVGVGEVRRRAHR